LGWDRQLYPDRIAENPGLGSITEIKQTILVQVDLYAISPPLEHGIFQ
jgi:hypothetical protein